MADYYFESNPDLTPVRMINYDDAVQGAIDGDGQGAVNIALKALVERDEQLLEEERREHADISAEIAGVREEIPGVLVNATLTGNCTAETPPDGDDSQQIATTAFVKRTVESYVPAKDKNIVYGFRINSNESDPATAVVYIADAVGMTPAFMNYQNGVFDYGSWFDAFFMPKPCMVKYDGTVDYYLDVNDYTLKENGTPSDVTNDAYEGNAMMEWGQNGRKIYYKIVPDSGRPNSASVYIANYKPDDGFVCYPFVNKDNVEVDHFYTAIYNGSNVNSRLRSLSGKTHMVSQSGTTELTYAQANGAGWNIECFADRTLISLLLILMGKSLDTQKVFGNGHYSGGQSASSNLRTGLLDGKGLFWGSNGNTGVKVFGMENYWAEVWRRLNGFIVSKGTYKIKLTEGTYDGSTAHAYNTTGEGYIPMGTAPASSNSNIRDMRFGNNCFLSNSVSGSSSTYYCDSMWLNAGIDAFVCVGGDSTDGAACGLFAVLALYAVSYAAWNFGACLSYKNS